MTETAWICFTVIVLACCGIIAYAIKQRSFTYIKVPLPFTRQPLELSANDAKRIIALQNQNITPDMIEALKKYNNKAKIPTSEQIQEIGIDILQSLAQKAYIEPEEKGISDLKQFKFGYVGRQILGGVFGVEDLYEPVSYHEELKKSV